VLIVTSMKTSLEGCDGSWVDVDQKARAGARISVGGMLSSRICHVTCVRIDVSYESIAYIISVKKLSELGTTLEVTVINYCKRCSQLADFFNFMMVAIIFSETSDLT
jgi:hypothetical protein